ncbi:hypothetical protein C8R44DRAFT_853675 [Mycena epipterygia]|nr:hypothetical protein C8R44DRAFT_853675 [Mycena epipterygia]
MHRCLLIPEIICMICEQISLLDSGLQTLSIVATTAKVFQYALDLLWKKQHGLLRLLKCMPPDVWETEERVGQPTSFVGLRRPVIPSDLDRLLFYSRRVKSFVARQKNVIVAAEALRTCLAGRILFPNLMVLIWAQPDSFSDLPLYLSPNIKHFGLALNDSAPHLGLLSTLTLRYPILDSVHVRLSPSASATRGVSTAVCGLRAVKGLTVNTLTVAALLHVAKIRNLNALNLLSLGNVHLSELPPGERFTHLQHLNVGAVSIDQCAALVRFLSASPLSTAFFALSDQESPASAWAAFTSALHDGCIHSTLRSIFIYHGALPEPPFARSYIETPPPGAVLVPLLAFSNLSSLVLEPPHGFDLDETLLRDMAAAWPFMEKLILGVSGAEIGSPCTSIPLRALLPFALHCPRLHTLGMVLDATIPVGEAEEELKKLKGGQGALRRLLLGPSVILDGNVTGVATFLARVFPKLDAIVCSKEHAGAVVWERVKEMSQCLAPRD